MVEWLYWGSFFSPLSANVLIDFSGSRYNCGIVQSDGTEADTSPYLFQLYMGPIERSTGKNSSYISSSAAMKPPRSILKTCLMSSISNRGFPIFFLSFYSKDLHFIYLRHLKEQLSSSVLRKVTNYIPFCNWLIYPIHYAFLPSGYRFTYVYVKFCFPFLTWNFLPWKGFEVERYKH